MQRLSPLLVLGFALACATPSAPVKEKEPEAPPRPIAGKVVVAGTPAAKARLVVLKHRAPLGAEEACACEDHPRHPLASCPAPESAEKMGALARAEPEAVQIATVTTGDDGAFLTPALPEGHYDLGVKTDTAQGWRVDVAAGARDVVIQLRPTSVIEGMVRSSSGPVKGAELVISSSETRDVRGVLSDDQGGFELAGVPLGAELVIANAPGFTPAKGSPAPAEAPDGRLAFSALGFQLAPRVTLRGAVTRAGAPVAGADVLAQSECRTYRAKTDAKGLFEIAGLPARDYPVSAISGSDGAQVLASLDKPGPLALELQRGGVLAGTVKDAQGPIAGADVAAVPRQPRGAAELRRARTHADGTFELGPMPPGKWQVEIAAAGHLARPPSEVRLTEGARQKLDVELAPATRIAGFVLNDLADGLPDAEVEAVRSDADPSCLGCRLTVRTEQDGSFLLYPLARGEYTVRVSHERYLRSESKRINPTDDLRIALKPGASLLVTVKDPDQAGGIRARVSLLGPDRAEVRPPRLADANGTYRLEGLGDGAYTAVVESGNPLARRAEAAVRIEDGAANPVEVSLPSGVQLAGRVADDAGKAVEGAVVQLTPEGKPGMAVVVTGADGAFELKRAPAGKYRATALRDGFLSTPKSAAPAEGGKKVALALSRLPAVKGRVRAGAPGGNVWVNGRKLKLDEQRRFRFPLLRAGKQVVVVELAGAAPVVVSADAALGREVDLGDLATDAGRAVEGTVTDPDGKPLARAMALVVDPAARDLVFERLYGALEDRPPLAAATTDAAGKFRVEHAPSREAVLLVRHPAYLPAELPVPAGLPTVTAALQPGGTVVGKALDAGGDPVRGTVTLIPEAEKARVLAGNVSDSGRFAFGGRTPGQYAVAMSALPSADGSLLVFDPQTVEVTGREAVAVELRARAEGSQVTVELKTPAALGALAARLLPADALDAPTETLYRRLFQSMPAEAGLGRSVVFRRAPAGPRTLVLLRDVGRGLIGVDRRRIDVPATGALTVTVDQVALQAVPSGE